MCTGQARQAMLLLALCDQVRDQDLPRPPQMMKIVQKLEKRQDNDTSDSERMQTL